jgi:hypothetical protein
MAGTANIAAPKTAATEKRFLFIPPRSSVTKNSTRVIEPSTQRKMKIGASFIHHLTGQQ